MGRSGCESSPAGAVFHRSDPGIWMRISSLSATREVLQGAAQMHVSATHGSRPYLASALRLERLGDGNMGATCIAILLMKTILRGQATGNPVKDSLNCKGSRRDCEGQEPGMQDAVH